MAIWLRLLALSFCVATISTAVADGQTNETTTIKSVNATKPTKPPACTDGDRRPDTTECHKYTECENGVWNPEKCFLLRMFDSVTKKCVWRGAKCAKQHHNPSHSASVIHHH